MKKEKTKMLNLALRFTAGVFTIIFISGGITVALVAVLHACGVVLTRLNPILMIILLLLPCIIIGTALAFFFGRKSLRGINKILAAVSEVGKGNFDVEIKDVDRPENIKEIAHNINVMAKELRNLEYMRKDFIQSFSHEFKTPIVSIQGFTNRLLTKELTEEEKREYLEIIFEESTRLAALSSNTLLMSKLESMDKPGGKKQFMLDEQLRRSVLLLEKQWTDKGVNMYIDDMPRLPLCGDEELLKQVWVNLLSNAIKFTPKGGEVRVTAKSTEKGTVVTIADSGIGLDGEAVKRIFDKYYQGDGSRATEGNGLGLSIVKKIIDLCGGGITVKSEAGSGTAFTVTLPA